MADKREGWRPSRSTDHEHTQGTSCSGNTRLPATERPRRLYPGTGTAPAHNIASLAIHRLQTIFFYISVQIPLVASYVGF